MKNVHEYTVDRATATAKIGSVNPARKFIRGELPPVTVQLIRGELHFFDQGDVEIDIEDVPQEVLEAIRTNPIRRGVESVEQVLKHCEFCPANDNAVASGDWEEHLKRHIVRGDAIIGNGEPATGSKPARKPKARKAA